MKDSQFKAISKLGPDGMFEYIKTTPVTDKVFVTDDVNRNLFGFLFETGRADPEGELELNPSMVFDGTIQIPDCEIEWLFEDTDGNSEWDSFRVVIFPEYCHINNRHKKTNVIFGFIYMEDMDAVIPLGANSGDVTIGFGDFFFADGSSVSFTDLDSYGEAGSPADMVFCVAAVWYAIQCAVSDPLTSSLFEHPIQALSENAVRHYKLNPEDIIACVPSLDPEYIENP